MKELFKYYLESEEKYSVEYFEKKFKVKTVKEKNKEEYILYPNLNISSKDPYGGIKYTDCIQLKIYNDKIHLFRANFYKSDKIKEFINSIITSGEYKISYKFTQMNIIVSGNYEISEKNIKKLISLALDSKNEWKKEKLGEKFTADFSKE